MYGTCETDDGLGCNMRQVPVWVPSCRGIRVCHVCICVVHVAVHLFVLEFSGQTLGNCGIRHGFGWASSKMRNKDTGKRIDEARGEPHMRNGSAARMGRDEIG